MSLTFAQHMTLLAMIAYEADLERKRAWHAASRCIRCGAPTDVWRWYCPPCTLFKEGGGSWEEVDKRRALVVARYCSPASAEEDARPWP